MDKIRSDSLAKLLHSIPDSDLSKLLEPVDDARLNTLITTYKQLNLKDQILFLLRIQNNGNTSNRSNELVETGNWLRANFSVDSQVAIPKEEVYQMYKKYTKLAKPVSTADFGKIVRQIFPEVKPRRLGQRGNSRYCYANIKRKISPDVPTLPSVEPSPKAESTSTKILRWANKTFSQNFQSLEEFSTFADYLQSTCKQNQQNSVTDNAELAPHPQIQHPQKRGVKRSGSSCSLQNQQQQQNQQLEKVPIPRLKREDSCTSDDPELQTYFCTTDEKWPHLRRLLTNSSSNSGSKKKRHFSTATIIQQSPQTPQQITPRSQSVPLNYIDSPYEEQFGGDSGIGSLSSTPRNPMLSSVSNEILKPNENLILMPQHPNEQQIEDQYLGFEFDPVFDIDFALN